jgi:C1A family cysteine protease
MPAPKKPRRRTSSRAKKEKRILNVEPSPGTENDWTIETAQQADMIAAAPPVPPSKDLRAAWWKVGNQGSTGSCVGWATADSVLRWHFVNSKRIANNEILSPRFIWMASKETDPFNNSPTTFIETEGTSLKAALDIARKFGAVRDKTLPFGGDKLFQGDAKTFYAIAAQLKILAYVNLGTNQGAWRTWLATKGPILTRLDVDNTFVNAPSNGNLDDYKEKTKQGGHAVAFVGYKGNRFIVRNSWGTTWGDKGFAYASPAYAQEAFTEAYGVTV